MMCSLTRRLCTHLWKCSEFACSINCYQLRALTQQTGNVDLQETSQERLAKPKQVKQGSQALSRIFKLNHRNLKDNAYIKHLLQELKSSEIILIHSRFIPAYTSLSDVLREETSASIVNMPEKIKDNKVEHTSSLTVKVKTDRITSDVVILPQEYEGKKVSSINFFDMKHIPGKFFFAETLNLIRKKGFYRYIQPEYFIFMDGKGFYRLFSEADSNIRKISGKTVICNLFFKKRIVLKVQTAVRSKGDSAKDDLRYAGYLVNLIPNRRRISSFKSNFRGFYYFCQQLTSSSNSRVIPLMEQFCPGIGELLILKGHCDMMETVGDLKNEQFLSIYKAMVSSVHYKGSPFKLKLDHREVQPRDEEDKESATAMETCDTDMDVYDEDDHDEHYFELLPNTPGNK